MCGNHTHLNNQWDNKEITREIRKYLKINGNENNILNLMGCSKTGGFSLSPLSMTLAVYNNNDLYFGEVVSFYSWFS